VATLTGVRGAVETRARGAKVWTAVKESRSLAEGEAVRVGKGGRATLFQPGCPPRALAEGAAVVVSAGKTWRAGPGAKALTAAQHRSVVDLLASVAQSSRSQPTVLRSQNPAIQPIIVSPRFESVLDGRPTLRWKAPAAGLSYELVLFQGGTEVWKTRIEGAAQIDYPRDRPPLPPGDYDWQITFQMPERAQEGDFAAFTVMDPTTAARVRAEIDAARALVPAESALNLPLISIYVTNRLFAPAEAALQRALAATPEDAALRRLLARVTERISIGPPGLTGLP
jgi:hypothetical protein